MDQSQKRAAHQDRARVACPGPGLRAGIRGRGGARESAAIERLDHRVSEGTGNRVHTAFPHGHDLSTPAPARVGIQALERQGQAKHSRAGREWAAVRGVSAPHSRSLLHRRGLDQEQAPQHRRVGQRAVARGGYP